jgi:hypothetical protein
MTALARLEDAALPGEKATELGAVHDLSMQQKCCVPQAKRPLDPPADRPEPLK